MLRIVAVDVAWCRAYLLIFKCENLKKGVKVKLCRATVVIIPYSSTERYHQHVFKSNQNHTKISEISWIRGH
jgi:hypothetical protein